MIWPVDHEKTRRAGGTAYLIQSAVDTSYCRKENGKEKLCRTRIQGSLDLPDCETGAVHEQVEFLIYSVSLTMMMKKMVKPLQLLMQMLPMLHSLYPVTLQLDRRKEIYLVLDFCHSFWFCCWCCRSRFLLSLSLSPSLSLSLSLSFTRSIQSAWVPVWSCVSLGKASVDLLLEHFIERKEEEEEEERDREEEAVREEAAAASRGPRVTLNWSRISNSLRIEHIRALARVVLNCSTRMCSTSLTGLTLQLFNCGYTIIAIEN